MGPRSSWMLRGACRWCQRARSTGRHVKGRLLETWASTDDRVACSHYRVVCLRYIVSQKTILPPFYQTEPSRLQNNYATAWKITQEFILEHVRYWMTKANTGHLTLLEIPLFISVHTRRSSENEMFKRTEEHDEVCLRIKHDDDGSHQRVIVKGREQDFRLSIIARFRWRSDLLTGVSKDGGIFQRFWLL